MTNFHWRQSSIDLCMLDNSSSVRGFFRRKIQITRTLRFELFDKPSQSIDNRRLNYFNYEKQNVKFFLFLKSDVTLVKEFIIINYAYRLLIFKDK